MMGMTGKLEVDTILLGFFQMVGLMIELNCEAMPV